MTEILIIGDERSLTNAYALALYRDGRQVETADGVFRARDRLAGPPVDLAIIDLPSADCSAGFLIEQARAAWPGCLVMVLVPMSGTKNSKLQQMGLFTPDAVLTHPVSPAHLVRSATSLLLCKRRPENPPAAQILA